MNNNNRGFQSSISVGSWRFTTEYPRLIIYINSKTQIYKSTIKKLLKLKAKVKAKN